MMASEEKSETARESTGGKTDVAERIERLECEAAMALLLSALVRTEPSGEWLGRLASDGVFEEAPFAADEDEVERGMDLLAGWERSWNEGAQEAGADALYSDYLALFVGPGAPLAAPWESVYAHEGEALVFQRETLEVRACYREFDLQVERLHHEPDDHVGYELEFVAALARREADARAKGDADEADRAACARMRFLTDHLAVWGDRWAGMVISHAKTPFYRGAALLFKGFLRAAS